MTKNLIIDIDNTIIDYSKAFFYHGRFASKNSCKYYFRHNYPSSCENDLWIELQGEVYGNSFDKISLYPFFKTFFNSLKNDFNIIFVSHKTDTTLCGRFQNIRQKIIALLQEKLDHSSCTFFFTNTLDEKIDLIAKLDPFIYIDDLEEPLLRVYERCPKSIPINFSTHSSGQGQLASFSNWNQILYFINHHINDFKLFSTMSTNTVLRVNDTVLKFFSKKDRFHRELQAYNLFSKLKLPVGEITHSNDENILIAYPYLQLSDITFEDFIDSLSLFVHHCKSISSYPFHATDACLSIEDYLCSIATRCLNLGINLNYRLKKKPEHTLFTCLTLPDFSLRNTFSFNNNSLVLDFESVGIDDPTRWEYNLIHHHHHSFTKNQISQISDIFTTHFPDISAKHRELVNYFTSMTWLLIDYRRKISSNGFNLNFYLIWMKKFNNCIRELNYLGKSEFCIEMLKYPTKNC